MQLKSSYALDPVVLFPPLGTPVASGIEESMKDGEKDGPLHREAEPGAGKNLLDYRIDSQLMPEALEDQSGADAYGAQGPKLSFSMRIDDLDGLGELQQ
jgi:hypothetical protein